MRTVSVKLPDATRIRIEAIAAGKGTSPHAFMVEALKSRDQMIASGKAFDGDDAIAYQNARARGDRAARPRLKAIKTILKSGQ
jgi:predicted transcriptional regulator